MAYLVLKMACVVESAQLGRGSPSNLHRDYEIDSPVGPNRLLNQPHAGRI